VEVTVPLRADFGATVRTIAASLGADAGFSVDELDDVRLALSEVFSALLDHGAGDARAHVVFTMAIGSMSIAISSDQHDDIEGIEFDELAMSILRSVTDEFGVDGARVVLVKKATEATTGVRTP
jgi:serine/threonine-protein kinase RsbW